MFKKKEKKKKGPLNNKRFTRRWVIFLSIVMVPIIATNIGILKYQSFFNNFLGGQTYEIINKEGMENLDTQYYKSDYASAEELAEAADKVVEDIEAEGMVLLKNNGALPLASDSKVTLLGRDAASPYLAGSGSGDTESRAGTEGDGFSSVGMLEGLQEAGLDVNMTVYDFTAEQSLEIDRMVIGMVPSMCSYYIGEIPVANYTDEVKSTFTQYGDAAIIAIGRTGGEGGDLATDIEGWEEKYEEGQHTLELNKDEKDMIAMAKENFDTVIVLLNTAVPMEMGILENDPEIDAILWVGFPGERGFLSVGEAIVGNINPSGRTVDTWAADFTKDPTFQNFGSYEYSNIYESEEKGFFVLGYTYGSFFVQYEEGIYSGYRYYETAHVENQAGNYDGFNYDEAVVYPFGYGLSYTDFTWEVVEQNLNTETGEIAVNVKVTNTGVVDGKDVVELYYTAPYTYGGIEKSAVILGAFAKTDILQPNESQVLTLTLNAEDMASYDYKNEKAYVLEAGDYILSLRTDAHNVKVGTENIIYNQTETIVYDESNPRSTDGVAATNVFDDCNSQFTDVQTDGYALNFSRADFAGTFPTTPTAADCVADENVIAGFVPYDVSEDIHEDEVMPTTGADNGISLIDVRGLDYNDTKWDLLLDQLTVEEMENAILNGAFNTASIGSVAKPDTTDIDGTAGLSAYMGTISCTAFPVNVVLASTWNVDLARAEGEVVGNEALYSDVNGWYAPGGNIHRSPFGGRNFEYYSEDGVLAGAMAANVISGAQSKGVNCYNKHFGLNEQEAGRVDNGIMVLCNEQAIREVYLKGFELGVKDTSATVTYYDENKELKSTEIGATAMMSALNRIGFDWAGGSKALLTDMLRNEWGFTGTVITDFNLYPHMSASQAIASGGDLELSFIKSLEDNKSASAVIDMRNSMHNILYTTINSNAANGLAPGAELDITPAGWLNGLYKFDAVVAGLFALAVVWIVYRRKKHAEPIVVVEENK